jgi:hypothetical protein
MILAGIDLDLNCFHEKLSTYKHVCIFFHKLFTSFDNLAMPRKTDATRIWVNRLI